MVANGQGMLKPGDALAHGKYQIVEEVGSGAMGMVYRALHTVLDRQVAIKVLNPLLISVSNAKARFLREAKAASKIQHRNSVQILDYGSEGEWLYIVMELLEGRELKDIIEQEAPFSKEQVAEIMTQVCSALTAAHEVGVIHRDLKPANIMVVSDRDDDGNEIQVVKVCDFGIAKVQTSGEESSGDSLELTATGMITGTPAYMSPEQAKGKKLDPRSDLYSCGVLMYIMVTKQLPFTADSPLGYLTQHVSDAPPAPSQTNPDVSKSLEAIIQKCLQKDPKARYQSAKHLRHDLLILKNEGSSENIQAPITPSDRNDWTWGTRGLPLPDERESYQTTKTVRTEVVPVVANKRPWMIIGGIVLVFLLGIIFVMSFNGSDSAEEEEFDTGLDVEQPRPKKRRVQTQLQTSTSGLGTPRVKIPANEEMIGAETSISDPKERKKDAKKPRTANNKATTTSNQNSEVSEDPESTADSDGDIVDEPREESRDESSLDGVKESVSEVVEPPPKDSDPPGKASTDSPDSFNSP